MKKANKIIVLAFIFSLFILGFLFAQSYYNEKPKVNFEKTKSEWCSYYYNQRLPYVVSTYKSFNLKENEEVNEIYKERYSKINFMDLYCN